MALPSFLIVGAMKSGTTSLHRYLGQHPDVFVSKKKELHFFAAYRDRDLSWYEEQFADGSDFLARGESSTSFTKLPAWPDATERLAALIPNAKLIYLMRDPVDRTFSHYCHVVRKGDEALPFSRALVEVPRYLNVSRYAMQIRGLERHFPPEQIELVSHERLEREPKIVVEEVLQFLGLRTDIALDTSRRWNETSKHLATREVELAPDSGIIVIPGESASPTRGRRWLRQRAASPLTPARPTYRLTPEMRKLIAAELTDDVAALRQRWPEMPDWPDFR